MKIPENIHKIGNIDNIKRKSFVLIRVQMISILIGRLKRKILVDFKKILSLYQISIVRILNFDYVKSFKMDENEHISLLANRLISGLNKNEINFGEKYDKNLGFFEKFFKFFT